MSPADRPELSKKIDRRVGAKVRALNRKKE